MYGSKFWKWTDDEDDVFDMSTSHTFIPVDALVEEAIECSQKIHIVENPKDPTEIGEKTHKMRKCKHDGLWKFSPGMPSDIIKCTQCSYWRFI